MWWIVRHGERTDQVDPEWLETAVRPFDPPLTLKGCEQAFCTGTELSHTRDRIDRIICSPSFRTVQTAAEIAKHVDVKICIDAGISEWLNAPWFPGYIPRWMTPEELSVHFPGYIDLTYAPCQPQPETYEDQAKLVSRCRAFFRTVEERFPNENIVMVTHGFMPALARLVFKLNEVPSPVPAAGYCSVTKIAKVGNRPWQSIFYAAQRHLITANLMSDIDTRRARAAAVKNTAVC